MRLFFLGHLGAVYCYRVAKLSACPIVNCQIDSCDLWKKVFFSLEHKSHADILLLLQRSTSSVCLPYFFICSMQVVVCAAEMEPGLNL